MRFALALLFGALTLHAQFFPFPGPGNPASSSGTSHTFTYVSRGSGCSAASASGALSCTANATGDLIIIHASAFNDGSVPTCSISGMTVTPNSPAANLSGTESECVGYVKSASSGSQTYTVTWTHATAVATIGMEFSCSPACSSVTLDGDANATAGAGTSTPVNTPNASAANSGELLTSGAYAAGNETHCGGSWTDAGSAISGIQACYIASGSSGTTAVNISDSSGTDSWASMANTWE